jgi:hypothetical protein
MSDVKGLQGLQHQEHSRHLTNMKISIYTVSLPLMFSSFNVDAFLQPKALKVTNTFLQASTNESSFSEGVSRRHILQRVLAAFPALVMCPSQSSAGTFTPGGTLVDRDVGATVGNSEASPSRKVDNSNVLFSQDNYFKFGAGAPWIEPDSTDFPKTMPFVLSQQRYDSLKKYGDRVKAGILSVNVLEEVISAGNFASIANGDDPKYALRPLGLLANGFLASENTGTTNELLLARWYINEIYLRLVDMRIASNKDEAMVAYNAAKKSINSYLAMMNRVVTSKVGNKFEYI